MDTAIHEELNHLLVNTFRSILKVEENMTRRDGLDLSIGEMHTVEAAGRAEGRTITEIANELLLSLPTVTVSVARLEKKGYLRREREQEDRRLVRVYLTEAGHTVDKAHRRFHKTLTRTILEGFTPEEESVLLTFLGRLNQFFTVSVSEAAVEKP